jgi:hypothetical protein
MLKTEAQIVCSIRMALIRCSLIILDCKSNIRFDPNSALRRYLKIVLCICIIRSRCPSIIFRGPKEILVNAFCQIPDIGQNSSSHQYDSVQLLCGNMTQPASCRFQLLGLVQDKHRLFAPDGSSQSAPR